MTNVIAFPGSHVRPDPERERLEVANFLLIDTVQTILIDAKTIEQAKQLAADALFDLEDGGESAA